MKKKSICLATTLAIVSSTTFAMQEQEYKFSSRVHISDTFYEKTTESARQKKVVFHWDVDDVLLNKNIPIIIGAAIGYLPISAYHAIVHAISHTPNDKQTQRPPLTFKELIKNKKPVDAWAEKFDPYGIGDDVISIANFKFLIKDVVKLVKNLDHTHNILTNQGTRAFKSLLHSSKAYAQFFNTFNVKTSVNYDTETLLEKPNLRYFQMHLDKCDPERTQIHIFIDDKAKNAKAAPQADPHYIGIQFNGDIEHLQKDLHDLTHKFDLQIKYKK